MSMRRSLRHRIEALEQRIISRPRCIRYGRLAPLPPDWHGERHVVVIRREPTLSPAVEWWEGEERIGPAPVATGSGI